MGELKISGDMLTDQASLNRYSSDMSHYSLVPRIVAIPKDEGDVEEILTYSSRESIAITPRGSGSNQSGSAVGEGIVILFSAMKDVVTMGSRSAKVQPGMIYDTLDRLWRSQGLRLTYDPSSRAFCTIGGNVGTKASGLRSLKYGNVDAALRSLRFFDMTHGLVDTGEQLPAGLEAEIIKMRDRLQNDDGVRQVLMRRGDLKSSSGYNLKAFYTYRDPSEIVAHLLVGSVGTLGIFTRVELEAVPAPPRKTLYIIFYRSLVEAAADVMEIRAIGPSSLELMDANALRMLREEHALAFPEESRALLMVELDSDLERTEELMRRHLFRSSSLGHLIEDDPSRQASLWAVRESMLLRIMHEMQTPTEKFPSFADDIGVPPENLPPFLKELQEVLERSGTIAVIFGHAGEGNLHIRPMVRTENWQDALRGLSDAIFRAALRYGGTISAEHGLGRNRSKYLRDEWGEGIYNYFKEIKKIFDPKDLLNPGVVFTSQDLTKNLRL
jgi:FAD/FMN-containing dehydrogenase